MAKTLYICYFGMREPLVQTQVLPYLREIRKDGVEISILTFEPGDIVGELGKEGVGELKAKLADERIDWHWLPYHKRFSLLATAWDILRGTLFIRSFIARHRPDVLHGRVHVPTLMGALARKLSRHKPKLLFDIRGFFPEEYTDAGIWPEGGLLYRSAKRVEAWLMRESEGFVVLTEKAREILFPESKETGYDKHGRPVEVVPCCVDMSRFALATEDTRTSARAEIGAADRFVIAYVGSFGGWYLTDEILRLYAVARQVRKDAFAMVITQRDATKVKAELLKLGYNEQDMFVGSISPADVPRFLCAADAAISFIKACYSKLSSSPTKIAEYLACGLPIIANRGVGDVDELLAGGKNGSSIDGFTERELISALLNVAGQVNDRAKRRQAAVLEFDLVEVGGRRYRNLYRRMTSND